MYTLSFTLKFEHTSDVCYLAYCYPYTYSDLQKDLEELDSKKHLMGLYRRAVLCKTVAGNICDVLTITAPARSMEEVLTRPG